MGCEPPLNPNFYPPFRSDSQQNYYASPSSLLHLLCPCPPAAMANLPPVTTASSQAILLGTNHHRSSPATGTKHYFKTPSTLYSAFFHQAHRWFPCPGLADCLSSLRCSLGPSPTPSPKTSGQSSPTFSRSSFYCPPKLQQSTSSEELCQLLLSNGSLSPFKLASFGLERWEAYSYNPSADLLNNNSTPKTETPWLIKAPLSWIRKSFSFYHGSRGKTNVLGRLSPLSGSASRAFPITAGPSPNSISVHLEGEGVAVVEVDVQYENIPCSECLFAGHLTAGCPYAVKPGLLKLPAKVIQTENPPPSTTAESAKDASIEDTQIPVPTSEISGDIDSVLDASVLVSKIVAASQVNSLPQPRPPPIGPKLDDVYPRMEELVNDALGRIGESIDSLMEDLVRDEDFHEDSLELKGHEDPKTRKYKSLFDDARQSLSASCPRVLTKLSSSVEFYSLKAQNGLLDNSFNDLLKLVKKLLPIGNTLPESTY
ncbi:hypothetical protein MRB53_014321 [Persea americana]|uniref:Uncharacterized protein n=1 Tax=Persea americana TaxID=3435 RepID=A0ACC2KAJ5_PERAE|nr:hypothetical protein MRB53_014321 [Persea americana]